MADSDLFKLYSGRILELASAMPLTTRLKAPDISVKRRSPQCGSTVTVDVCLTDGRISDFGQDVKACALGQASAALVGAHIIGPMAGDLIHEVCVAMEFGASAEDLALTCHAHPTYSEAVREAALACGDGPIHS